MDFFTHGEKAKKYVRKSVFLSLAYCYYARLPRSEREEVVKKLVSTWKDLQDTPLYGAGAGAYGSGAIGYGARYSSPYTGAGAGAGVGAGGNYWSNWYAPKARCKYLDLSSPSAFVQVSISPVLTQQ